MTRNISPRSPEDIPQQVARQAVEWMLELQSTTASDSAREAWTRWRAQHPSHELAWQRIESVRDRFGGLSATAAVAHATLTPTGSCQRRHAVKALAVLLFGAGIAWTVEEKSHWQQWRADLRTGVGEQLRTTLADGTLLMLNTDSAVNVLIRPNERRLQLVAGEIYVATAKEERPFLIETRQGLAQALGTRFTVRSIDDRARVAVFEGAVRLTPTTVGVGGLVLQAGEAASFTKDAVDATRSADENSKAWVEGTLVARSMRLREFLAELSRYTPHTLSCDPAVADLRVSGSYPVAQVPLILDAVSTTLSLQVETVTRFWGRQVVSVRLAPRTAPSRQKQSGAT